MRRVIMVYDAASVYNVKVIMGVATYLQERANFTVAIEDNALGRQRLPDFRSCDGIIAGLDDPTVASALGESRVPIVGFGGGYRWNSRCASIPYFRTNNRSIARLAADHLLKRGFKHFAYVGYPRTNTNAWSHLREAEFVKYIASRGFPCPVFHGQDVFRIHYKSTHRWAAMQKSLAAWLGKLPKPLGVMAANDGRGRHVLEACRAYNLRVPDDIAVIGVDNDELLCKLSSPPLSSVEQGARKLGYAAAALLDEIMDGRKTRRRCIVVDPTGIVTRHSTDVLAIDDLTIRRAMEFIRRHGCDGIKVPDVIADAGISRSGLENRFASVLGTTIHAAIRCHKVETARKKILESEMPLKQIAAETGFKSVQLMTKLFAETIGQTPAKYRRTESQTKPWDFAGDAHERISLKT